MNESIADSSNGSTNCLRESRQRNGLPSRKQCENFINDNSPIIHHMKVILFIPLLAILPALAQKPAAEPPAVLAEKVTLAHDKINGKYIGRIEAVNKVSLQPRVSGILVEAPFHEGDIVRKGDVLFRIEDTRYKAAVQAGEAKVEQLNVKIDYAKKNYERQRNLLKTSAVSKDQVDSALSLLKEYEAQKAEAEANLILSKEDLSYTVIPAPITGRIGRVTYSVGNYITPTSQPLATIAQIDPIYVRFPMSERDVLSLFGNTDQLKKDATVHLITAASHKYGTAGFIALANNEVQSDTDTLTVWAQFDNPEQTLQPGGIATVLVNKKETVQTPAVTVSAVLHDSDGAFVYVVDGNNTASRRNVITGSVNDKKQSIYNGLSVGETVIIDGTHKVRPGETVSPVFPEQKN